MSELDPRRYDKFRVYRARKRAAGMREVRFWVPDVRTDEFWRRSVNEADALRACAGEEDTMRWIDALHASDPGIWD